MAILLDTNLLVRYFTEDDLEKARAVAKLLKNSKEKLIITDVAFAEIVWVLQSFYSFSKEDIVEKLMRFVNIPHIDLNREVLRKTLYYFSQTSLSFIDAYEAAYCENKELDGIYSYDRGFDKIKSIKRIEP